MKHLNIVFAAFVGISSARSVLTARQEDNKVTPEKICAWFETRLDLPTGLDERCRPDAQKCIDNQLKKSQVLDQVAQDDITLCTFGPRIGNPSTDYLSICDDLDVTRETCRSNTSWCVMEDDTHTQDKNTALDRVRSCVAERILNEDGDETSVKCNSTVASRDLGRAICNEDHFPVSTTWEEEDEKYKLVEDCRKEFYRTTPASDILKHTQLGQYCHSQGVEAGV
ncbi:hypothetical protein MGU_09193 [Metarhizium guizhouense ARSEF 977]|uniref:Uncharacterized protein n=1 Tax=Metarhizium guizhouense (strain ARSEF 977) TaxID=1276136 RepID=A0A0B4GLR5_METGA|nr:hypothetical protein MGU_09193 [Metarhizium guizhouense ARSEF 977]